MKVLLLSNQSRSMAIFWRVLIQAMLERGFEVICCVPPGDVKSEQKLTEMGATIINYRLDRKGLNPINDLRTQKELERIFAAEEPDLIFATTIKPVIYGALAAHRAGIANFYATITGLGYAFERDSLLKKAINKISKALYRRSLRHAAGIFFQNPDDADLFRKQGLVDEKARILHARGTGVDTAHFPLTPLSENRAPVFLLVARLLEAKGIKEYAEAARKVKKRFPSVRFQLLGPEENGPGSIPVEQIREWEDAIEYLGEASDVRPFMAAADVIVLPSWREGLPTVLMEAMSMGRAIIATNVPGCRELVDPGVNGLLAEAANPDSLAASICELLEQPKLISKMGLAGRRLAEEKYDARVVAEGILKDMLGGSQ